MGCDIHLYVEHRRNERGPSATWSTFGGRFNPGRDYRMFGTLAGVRGGTAMIPPRGIPSDLACSAEGDWWLYITETPGEEYVTAETAAKYHSCGSAYKNDRAGKPTWIQHPDWHSASWVTCAELEQAVESAEHEHSYKVYSEYRAVLAAMKSLEESGHETRAVFWFDN